MNNISPLIKRIKRHITGPLHSFFISTAPGLENLCKEEMCKFPFELQNIRIRDGGVEFRGRLNDCYLANIHLRTANRILMRISEFKATNFRKLEKKLAEIPWELYLKSNTSPGIISSTRHSRIYHTDAISQRVLESIKIRKKTKQFYRDGNSDNHTQKIFIRSFDDNFTVSMDSSGELLYKRGIKDHGGAAPIRETFAAAALIKAEYTGEGPVFDPMCGTGTFSIESAMTALNIPPGLHRGFAFESWPGFNPARLAYMKRQAEKGIKKRPDKPLIVACDRDSSMCGALSGTLKKHDLERAVKVLNDDFFSFRPDDIFAITGCNKPGLVIINPPYGKRLGSREESKRLLIKITEKLTYLYSGWKFALFSPEKEVLKKCPLKGDQTIIDHGGIKLILFTGVVSKEMENGRQ